MQISLTLGSPVFEALVIPSSGWGDRAVIGFVGALFLAAVVKGFVRARAGRVTAHRERTIRAFAVGLAGVTMCSMFATALLATVDPSADRYTLDHIVGGGVCPASSAAVVRMHPTRRRAAFREPARLGGGKPAVPVGE